MDESSGPAQAGTSSEIGKPSEIGGLGVKPAWAKAILAGDTWASNAGVTYRVIDGAGKEQKINGKRARLLSELSDLARADLDIGNHCLVVPNKASADALCQEVIVPDSLKPLPTLEDDCGKVEPPVPLARALKLGVDSGKLRVLGQAEVAQAAFSVANNASVMNAVLELFRQKAEVRKVAETENFGAIGHIAYMLANTWNTADEVHVAIKEAGGWGPLEGLTTSTITESQVTGVAEAYANLCESFKASKANELQQDRAKVSAVLSGAGTKDVKEV